MSFENYRKAKFHIPMVPGPVKVSIHASAREATGRRVDEVAHMRVSIHASAREATSGHGLADDVLDPVSIHASAREATGLACPYACAPALVSIHASAREATV